jgi:hypothetical protein
MACNLLFGRQESAEELNLIAPDLHEFGAENLAVHSGLVKTHYFYSPQMPLAERTAAAIYVIRHPADVLVSNFYYAQRSSGTVEASRDDFDRYVDRFIESRGDPRWIQLGMGSWEANVRSWLGRRHSFPVIQLKYEELTADPKAACAVLARLIRPDSSALEVEAAVLNSSFDRMRELEAGDIRERRIGIFYKPYLQGAIESGRRFMRSGAVGDGSRLMTPDQRARLAKGFERLLAELGYTNT